MNRSEPVAWSYTKAPGLTVLKIIAGVDAVIDGSLSRSSNEALLGAYNTSHMSTSPDQDQTGMD
jgi:hypothetical protein